MRGRHRGPQLVEVEPEVGGAQRHRASYASGHLDHRDVGVVVGLEHDDLVARVDQPEQRRRDGLGAAGRHDDLAVGVELDARSAAAGGGRSPAAAAGRRCPGAYWLRPARSAATARAITSGGPSRSGNPGPRLTDPVRTASADIW